MDLLIYLVVVVGGRLVICKIVYTNLFLFQKFLNSNFFYFPRKPSNQTAPNFDNLGESYGCLNSGLLARGGFVTFACNEAVLSLLR